MRRTLYPITVTSLIAACAMVGLLVYQTTELKKSITEMNEQLGRTDERTERIEAAIQARLKELKYPAGKPSEQER